MKGNKRPLIRHRSSDHDYKNIVHCRHCKDGRIIKARNLVFCGLCGKEFRK